MLAEKAEYPITPMARIPCVSGSGFYSWLSNGCPEDDRSAEREAVGRVWLESDRRFGARFVECVSVNLFFTSFAKQARRSRKGGFTGCANVFSPIPVTA